MNRRSIVFWVGLGLVLVVVALFSSGRRNETGQPLDPDSTDNLGTRALVELVERFGADVTRGLPSSDSTTALVLSDQLSTEQRSELQTWIAAGGTAVVTDPGSRLAAELVTPVISVEESLGAGSCSLPSLEDLTLEAGSFLLFDVDGADGFCFGDENGAYLHVDRHGDGRVVSLGGGIALTNQYLDEADNAVLAVELLLSEAGGGTPSIAVLFEPVHTPGSRTLTDLVPTSARWGAAQLLVAFAVFVAWRSRRFGSPVMEPQPVKLPGSLLVRAAGELRRRTRGYEAADDTLRRNHERSLRRRLRAPVDLPAHALIDDVSDASGVDRTTIERSLLAPAATSGKELVELVRAIDMVTDALDQDEAAHSRPTASPVALPETRASGHKDEQPVGVQL